MPDSMIRTLFVDLFGVLIGSNEKPLLEYIAKRSKCDMLTIKNIIFGEYCMKLERNEISFNEYYKTILLELNSNIDFVEFQNLWNHMAMGILPMTKYIAEYQKHFKLYILSNTTEQHIDSIRKKYSFISQFDGVITSEQAGAHKPDKKIFKYACSLVKQNFENCAFIDDSIYNVRAASALGINSHLYLTDRQLRVFLKSLL
jgi:HAD superfamily hydrolase (TIGR01509 family)